LPCIVCKKDRWSSLRIPLDAYTEARAHYFRENYFTNHEFDHVCRFCNLKEGVLGLFVNTLGWLLNLGLRSWLIVLGVLFGFGFCLKFGITGRPAQVAPVACGLFVGGILGVRFVRWFFFGVGGLAALIVAILVFMNADVIGIMPDVTAMAQREQIKRGRELTWQPEDIEFHLERQRREAAAAGLPTTGIVFDPIAASEYRSREKRKKKFWAFLDGLVKVSPVRLDLDEEQFQEYLKLCGLTLVLYVLMVMVGGLLLGGVAREEEEKRRRKKQERLGRRPGGR